MCPTSFTRVSSLIGIISFWLEARKRVIKERKWKSLVESLKWYDSRILSKISIARNKVESEWLRPSHTLISQSKISFLNIVTWLISLWVSNVFLIIPVLKFKFFKKSQTISFETFKFILSSIEFFLFLNFFSSVDLP